MTSRTVETLAGPPLCNTGANNRDSGRVALKWDWYEATVEGSFDVVARVHAIARALGAGTVGAGQWEPCRGFKQYVRGLDLKGVPVGSVKVYWNAEDIHVQGTGGAAESVAEVLRREWPDHRVSRADVAYDVVAPGSFERLYEGVHAVARMPRQGGKVGTSTVGDWIDRENGRTFYAGGPSSRVRVRVYEKGYEQRAKDPGSQAPLDWTRVEWQLRPSSSQKAWLARASKVEALGLSKFGADVGEDLFGSEIVAVGGLLRFASQDPAYWMVRQYRGVLVEWLGLDPVDAMARLAELLERVEVVRD